MTRLRIGLPTRDYFLITISTCRDARNEPSNLSNLIDVRPIRVSIRNIFISFEINDLNHVRFDVTRYESILNA